MSASPVVNRVVRLAFMVLVAAVAALMPGG